MSRIVEPVETPIAHKTDFILEGFGCDGFKYRWWLHNNTGRGCHRGILGLVRVVHPILEKVERHAQRLKTELFVKAKLLEAKEIFVDVSSKIASHKLIAAVVKGADAISASLRI